VGDGPGLSGSGAGQNAQGTGECAGHLTLLSVEAAQDAVFQGLIAVRNFCNHFCCLVERMNGVLRYRPREDAGARPVVPAGGLIHRRAGPG